MKTTDILSLLLVVTVLFIFVRECAFEAARDATELSSSQGAVDSKIPQGFHRRENDTKSVEASDGS